MKAKLVKHESGYILYDEDNITIGAEPNVLSSDVFSKLSLKNCQAIERGYDLDELAREFCHPGNGVRDNFQPVFKGIFIQGFQKCLELMGDKKFSEVNMEDAYYFGSKKCREEYLDFIKTFQQTEWEVEIIMESVGRVKLGIGSKTEQMIPKLDADGCLILKRINL